MSSVGSTETYRAAVSKSPRFIGFAALDAGLVMVDPVKSTAAEPVFLRAVPGGERGEQITIEQIEVEWGDYLRANLGIRRLRADQLGPHVPVDVAAPLPHDFEDGGLRRLAGLTFSEIRQSPLMDMFGLFDDDPRLAPSLQSQLFMYGALGALASLPRPLSELLPEPKNFRVVAGCAFPGHDGFERMRLGMQAKHETEPDRKNDNLAARLATCLNTHGPALVSTMLSPVFNLSRVRRNPELLEQLRSSTSPFRRVPQAPLVVSGACASALISFCAAAGSALSGLPGAAQTDVILWTAADAGLKPDARILEAFGLGAMMSVAKLDALNAGRAPAERRSLSESLAPFDIDAHGTVVGHAGSGLVVTTLDFALRHGLDISSIIVGFCQSGETGGKGHFAGVGFGGENSTITALRMAREGHGYGLSDFEHLVAHATGTRTNSRTDLAATHNARRAAAELEGFTAKLPQMTVGAPKSVGDGHSMGETGLKAIAEAVRYLLGETSVGIPTLRHLDDELGEPAHYFRLSPRPITGNPSGGVLVPTQGFGGYNGAIALRGATPDTLARYQIEPSLLAAYLERWPEIRKERIEREARLRRTPGFVRRLAEEHRWKGI
jgi:3-oxoacyl-[acyl-carrier-protein] synthase II